MNEEQKEKLKVVRENLLLPFTNLPLLSRRLKETWDREGLGGIFHRVKRRVVVRDLYEPPEPTAEEQERIEYRVDRFEYKPLISVVVPVHDVAEVWLREAVESVRRQIYPHWELCLADDASTFPHIPQVLREYAELDPRIRFVRLEANQHISGASNAALALASGEYVALLDHDDALPSDALYEVVALLNEHPEADMIYTDEAHLHPSGKLTNPHFKPDWAPDQFLSQMYTCHLGVYRRSLVEKIGGFRKGYEGSQDYDLVLRLLDHDPKIFHIPKVLYHWRMISTSVACNPFAKDYPEQAALKALQDYLDRNRMDAKVEKGRFYTSYRVRYTIKEPLPVAIVMPTRNQVKYLRTAIDSIRQKTDYPYYRLYVVDNGSDEPETLRYLDELDRNDWASVLPHPVPFNFSAINNYAVTRVKEPVILFLNNDVEVLHPHWLEAMVEHIQRPEVGVVGGKLYYPDGSIQHAGVILGIGGVAGHSHKGLPGSFLGYFGRAEIVQNVSAVTGACLMTRREVFEAVGGLDEENLAIAFNDVDFCLKVREKGWRIIYTPYAELIHHESKSRGYEDTEEKIRRFGREIAFCQGKWDGILERDPFYNPNLTLEREDFSIKEGVLA